MNREIKKMITVIIPTYNRAANIGMAIESVLAQTYRDFELLIVDDGSNDNTEDVVKKYNDSRIRYVKYTPNQGAAHARNVGIKEAKGKYIAFHDSDDLMRSYRLKEQLDYLERNDLDFVFSQVHEYGMNKEDRGVSPLNVDIGKNKFLNTKSLLRQWQVWCQTILCTRECAEKVLFDENFPCGIDWDFSIRLSMEYNMGYYPLEVSDNYRLSSSISANNNNQYRCHFILRKKYENIIKNDKALNELFIQKDFDYKYSFGYLALSEGIRVFAVTKNPVYLLKGGYSILRAIKRRRSKCIK